MGQSPFFAFFGNGAWTGKACRRVLERDILGL
jgi:hypothetical protein